MLQKFGMVTEFSPSYYNVIINIFIIVMVFDVKLIS